MARMRPATGIQSVGACGKRTMPDRCRSFELKPLYVLGKPIAHSRSPVFQNAALRAAGLPEVYQTREVDAQQLADVADELRQGKTLGCNITLPHKESAAALADRRTDAVLHTGVANTWWLEQGELWADNTDIYGLQMSFAALLGERLAERVVVLGAGGAAQAALFALAGVAKDITLINRTVVKAEQTLQNAEAWLPAGVARRALAWPSTAGESDEANAALVAADLVVQTSSIPVLFPQDPQPFAALDLESIGAGQGALLELVYSNEPTIAMQRASAGGAKVLDGATMLLHQGARSFERWIGLRPNIVAMRDALADALGRERADIAAEIPEHLRERWGADAPRDAKCNRR